MKNVLRRAKKKSAKAKALVTTDQGPKENPGPGRPKINIFPPEFEKVVALNPTLEATAHFFECSQSTIENFTKETYGINFSDFREQKAERTRYSLRQKAIDLAVAGDNTMLIFSLKNYCGWSDKTETKISTPDNQPLVFIAKWGNTAEPTDGNANDGSTKDT